MNEFRNVNVNELEEIMDKINLIDIRESDEYALRSLKYTKNIPMHELIYNCDDYLNMDEEYYLICETGRRSFVTAAELAECGYNVINVTGGTSGYSGDKLN
ncbi:rhodanese-like domain-containing protein [uncultured Clostridium sp.]|uniref:rhodanese-like domain-containing protein n=1 Tax=uncultured Clostridium sp. TaxID=59620 RepID=UPI0025F7FA06|nr:rhodanese-like domain-containing protein [uncultured Clostridium sp.]